jgi:hypothetical protein
MIFLVIGILYTHSLLIFLVVFREGHVFGRCLTHLAMKGIRTLLIVGFYLSSDPLNWIYESNSSCPRKSRRLFQGVKDGNCQP